MYNNPSSEIRYFLIGFEDQRREDRSNHEKSLVSADLRYVNMASQWISMFMLFWWLLKSPVLLNFMEFFLCL
jgi:hypothetical protein